MISTKNHNNCLLVPTFPKHYKWTEQLLNTANPEIETIILGFSSTQEAEQFTHPFPYRTVISNVLESQNGFITHKKLDLLRQVYKEFNYVALIDAETLILRPVCPELERLWNENCFIANHSSDGKRMLGKVAQLSGYNYTGDLYPWLNGPPLYKCELLDGFFKWLDLREKKVLEICETFDFTLFALYCQFELGMSWRKLGDMTVHHGLVENADEWSKHRHLIGEVPWSTWYSGVEQNSNILMLFHLDRYPRS